MGRKKGELASLIRESGNKRLYRVQMEFAHGGYINFFRGVQMDKGGRVTSKEYASFQKALAWFEADGAHQPASS